MIFFVVVVDCFLVIASNTTTLTCAKTLVARDG
jgi:hypothetical protein